MVKIFCKFCLTPVAATDWKSHITQKQHLQQLPCKIVVKGPFKKDEIHKVFKYFMKFGGVRGQNVTTHEDEVCIEYRFWNARVYSDIIHQEHLLFDNEVEISWYKKVKSGALQHVLPDERMYKENFVYRKLAIINSLKELSTFEDELTQLQNKLKITKTKMETNRKIIYDDLNAALLSNFPRSMIHFFGSSVTNLDIHDSDLNIYIDNTDSELATLELIKDQIENSKSFIQISLNPDNETPIIKCVHKKTKVFCEINIRNEIPVGNSELIKSYLMIDERLTALIILIKFWVDCCDLRGDDGLSSYAMYLMVLFYLQQEPYKLPSVADLQKDLPPDEVDGWNCTFGSVEFTSVNLEKATIFELMVGFFEFYSHFDYISKVISPYFGSALEKVCFLKPCDLPECFEDYISQDKYFVVNSGICIQDVFEHSKNVSLSNDLSCIGRFAAVCRNSLELVRSETKEVLYKLLVSNENLNQFSLQNQDFCDEHEWICLIKTLVLTILRKICCCDVGEKIEDTYIHYTCKGEFNIWDNRIESLKNLCVQSSLDIGVMNIIDKELAVTSHILNNCSKGATWKMVVSLKFYTDPCRVSVSFREEENVPLILHIQHFVYVKLLEALNDKDTICMDNTNLEVPMTKANSLVEKAVKILVKSEESIVSSNGDTNPPRIEADDKERQDLIKTENLSTAESSDDDGDSKISNVTNSDVEKIISCDNKAASINMKKERHLEDQIIIEETLSGVDCGDIQVVTERNDIENLTTVNRIEANSCVNVMHDEGILRQNCKSEFAEANTISANVEAKEPGVDAEEVQTITNLCEPEDAPTLQDFQIVATGENESVKVQRKEKQHLEDEIIFVSDESEDTQVFSDRNGAENLSTGSQIDNISCTNLINNENVQKQNREFVETRQQDTDDQKTGLAATVTDSKNFTGTQNLQTVATSGETILRVQVEGKQNEEDEIILVSAENRQTHLVSDIKVVRDRNNTEYLSTGNQISDEKKQNEFVETTKISSSIKAKQQDMDGQITRLTTPSESENLARIQDLQTKGIGESHTLKVKVEDKQHPEDVTDYAERLQTKSVVELDAASTSGTVEVVVSCLNETTKVDVQEEQHQNMSSTVETLVKEDSLRKNLGVRQPEATTNKDISIDERVIEQNSSLNSSTQRDESTSVETEDYNSFLKTIEEGATFSDQVAIFEKNLTIHRDKIMAKQKTLIQDLSTVLAPVFPKIAFVAYDTNNTGYHSSKTKLMHVHVDVDIQNNTLDLMERLISNSNKFTRVWRPGIFQTSIQAEHVDMHIPFELNVSNKSPLLTSQLIRHYMSLDHRIFSLFTLIQHWNDMFDDKFTSNSNNSILLMAIFYLQVVHKFSAVAELQVLDFPEGLDFSKNEVVNLKNATVFDLVIGFFRFYDTFDYVTYVISPYFGALVEKTRLLKPYDLPECYQQYMSRNGQLSVGSSIDVQDPFELYQNLTVDVTPLNLGEFIGRCRRALLSLQDVQSLSFLVPYLKPCPLIMIHTIEKKVDQDQQQWLENVKVVLVKLLKDVVDCTSLPEYKASGVLFGWACKGERNVFQHRPHAAKRLRLPTTISNIDKEIAITKAVNAQFMQSMAPWDLQLEIISEGSNAVTMSLKKAPPVPGIEFFEHFLYVHLMEALNGGLDIKQDSLQAKDYITTIPLAERLEDISSVATQAATIRTNCSVNEIKFKQNSNTIEGDLKSALSSAFTLKKVFFNFRLMSSETLNIYIEIEIRGNQSDTESLKKIKELISKNENFSDIYLISEAIRCIHTKTDIVCEINTTDKLSEKRSNLLKYYSCLNDKVSSLMYFVKFWSDHNILTGLHGFSSNAIYIMVIFFLQLHYKLPSVKELQHGAVQQDIDGWNCAFQRHELANCELQNITMRDLVLRFFAFYGNFDYISQVISPYLGQTVKKVLFLQPHELPDSYDRYIKNKKTLPVDSSICVQDFFDHSKNHSSAYLYLCGKFATLCRISSQLIVETEENFFQEYIIDQRTSFSVYCDDLNDIVESIHFTEHIFKKVFGCTMTVSERTETVVQYHCGVTYDIWTNRIQCMKNVQVSDAFCREVGVTSDIVRKFPHRSWGNFHLAIKSHSKAIEIRFLAINDFPLVFHMCHFLHVNGFKLPELNIAENRDEVSIRLQNTRNTCTASSLYEDSSTTQSEINGKLCQVDDSLPNASTIVNSNINAQAPDDPSIVDRLIKKNHPTFAEQVSFFYSNFCTSDTTLKTRIHMISADLCSTLKHNNFTFYGSSLLKVHLPHSDINIKVCNTPIVTIHKLLDMNHNFKNATILKGNSIKCLHCPTNQNLTFTSRDVIAVATHDLLSYYLRSAEKVRVLVATIKQWTYTCNLTAYITGHIITIMVIFYLQVEHQLPSVAFFQKTCSMNLKNSWNVAFSKTATLDFVPQATVFDLVKGFFKFYEEFDYFSMVVAPFCGTPVAKTRFLRPFSLPEEYRIYRNQRQELIVDEGMCIQCPFEHTRNLAVSVPYATAATFAILCRQALDRMHRTETKMFVDLLTFHNPENAKFSLVQPANVSRSTWSKSFQNLTVKILKQVLGAKVIQSTSVGLGTTRYKCQGSFNVLNNRIKTLKKISKELRSDGSFLDREIAVTSHIVQNSVKEAATQIFIAIDSFSFKGSVFFSGALETTLCHFVYTRLLTILNSGRDSKTSTIQEKPTSTVVPKRKNEDSSANPAAKRNKVSMSSELKHISANASKSTVLSEKQSNAESSQKNELVSAAKRLQDVSTPAPATPSLVSSRSFGKEKSSVISTATVPSTQGSIHISTEKTAKCTVLCKQQTISCSSSKNELVSVDKKLPPDIPDLDVSSKSSSEETGDFASVTTVPSISIDKEIGSASHLKHDSINVSTKKTIESAASAVQPSNSSSSENNEPKTIPADEKTPNLSPSFLPNIISSKSLSEVNGGTSISKTEELKQTSEDENKSILVAAKTAVISAKDLALDSTQSSFTNKSVVTPSVEEIAIISSSLSNNIQHSEVKEVKISTTTSSQAEAVLSSSEKKSGDRVQITRTTSISESETTAISSLSKVESVKVKEVMVQMSPATVSSSKSETTSPCLKNEIRSSEDKIETTTTDLSKVGPVTEAKDATVPIAPANVSSNTPRIIFHTSSGQQRCSKVKDLQILGSAKVLIPSISGVRSSTVEETLIQTSPVSSSNSTPNQQLSQVVSSPSSSATTVTSPNQKLIRTNPIPSFNPIEAKLAILKETQSKSSFTAQISHFCTKLLVDEKTVEANQYMINLDLNKAMGGALLDKINFFGSSTLGLFTKGGHFYIYINKPECRNAQVFYTQRTKQEMVKLQLLKSGNFYEICASATEYFVKCKHKQTNIECIISMYNKLSVRTSYLIKYYLSLDPKLRQLFFVIKCWSELKNVKEESCFSNYAIYLMIIFYLQQEPYKLPSVSELQKISTPMYVRVWNTAFVPVPVSNEALKTATLKDLVFGFFKFYATFDFYSYVIAPFYGSVVNKVHFLKPFQVPPCYQLFVKVDIPMTVGPGACIQDPFELTKNVANGDNVAHIGKFSSLCRAALQLENTTEKQLLGRLLTPSINSTVVHYHGCEIEKSQQWDEQNWIQTVRSVVFTILTKILCCEIVKMDKTTNAGGNKTQITNKDEGKAVIDHTVITCKGTREIWKDRVNIFKLRQKEIPLGSSYFNVDVFLSRIIMKDAKRALTFDLNVEMVFMRNPTSVRISVLDAELLHLTHFFYTRLMLALETAQVEKTICKPCQVVTVASAVNTISEPYKILVKGKIMYATILEMHEYFSKFGKILNLKVLGEDKKLAVEYCFADRNVYLKVIQNEHIFSKNKLNIIPLAPVKTKIPNANFQDWRLKVIHNIIQYPTFEQQVDNLSNEVNSFQEKTEQKYELIRNFKSALFSKFSCSKIFTVSNITSVDMESHDLDVYIEGLSTDNESATLIVLKELICESRSFCSVLHVSESNDSFITCKHIKTSMKCYLRINKLKANHHRLIKYYLSLDSKLPKFMLLLKFWAGFYDLIDAKAFSDSAIYLMAIFYLQQEPYKLPSVKNLQSKINPEIVNGWNCAYAEIPEFTSPALKAATTLDLLTGFFKFYSNFNYVTLVISPYFGLPIQKVRFLKPYVLPKSFEQFKTNRKDLNANCGVFVQDFFEHGLNVASSVSLDCMGIFTNLCRSSLQLINPNENLLLYKLLVNVQRNIFEYPEFVIDKDRDRDEQEWIQTVKTLTMKILSSVLNYKVSTAILGVERTSFECIGQHNVWNNRIKAMKTVAGLSRLRGMKKEVAITTQVAEDFPEKISWNLFLDLTFTKNPCRVKAVFRRNPGCCKVYHVCHFVYTKLVKFLKEHDARECPEVVEVECESPKPPLCKVGDSINKHQKKTDKIPTCSELEVIDLTVPGDTQKLLETSAISTNETKIDLTNDVDANKFSVITNTSENNIEVDVKDANKSSEGNLDVTKETTLHTIAAGDETEEKDDPTRKRKRSHSEKEDEEDDDVPSDFFDDFANEDFLDGLDIAHALDSESHNEQKTLKRDHDPTSENATNDKGVSKSDHHKERSSVKGTNTKKKLKSDQRRKERSTFKGQSNHKKLSTPETKSDANKIVTSGYRQKLQSTPKFRDIGHYLIKCRIRTKSRSRSRSRDRQTKDRLQRKCKSRSSSPLRKNTSNRIKTRIKTKTITRIRSRSPSPFTLKRRRTRSRSPIYCPRRRSLGRDPCKTSTSHSTSTKMKLPQNSSRIRIRSRSPHELTRRKRSRSPDYRFRRRSLSRDTSRSRSPLAPRRRKITQNSLLEEIKKKINEIRPVVPAPVVRDFSTDAVQPVAVPHVSLPISSPHSHGPVGVENYDENFFIGPPVFVHASYLQPEVVLPSSSLTVTSPLQETKALTETREQDVCTQGDSDKLFEKTVSVTDFLASEANQKVSASIDLKRLQEQVKVLCRCQNIIQFLTHDVRLTSRRMKPSTSPQPSTSQNKYQSPLRTSLELTFKFTSEPEEPTEDVYSEALEKILQIGGVTKKVEEIKGDDVAEKVTEALESLKKALSDAVDH